MASDALNKLTTGKAGPYFGFLLALLIGISFAYLGLYTLLCGFGGALICAILLYMMPKSMGANIKHLAVFGVIFLVAVSAFSTYAVSKPFVEKWDGVHSGSDFKDVSVSPFWDEGPYEFNVTYSGGDLVMRYKTVDSVQQRGFIIPRGNPTEIPHTYRAGYTLEGWYLDKNFNTAYDFSSPVTKNITLYAKWSDTTLDAHSVSFNVNEGSAVSRQVVNEGGNAVQPIDPVKEGFVFDGWYSDEGLTALYNFSTPVTSDMTLHAKWTGIASGMFTVSFNTNGGSALSLQLVADGDKAVLPTEPSRGGYTFGGWYSNSKLTIPYDFDTPVTDDITLYAKWNVIAGTHKVSFNTNGGSPVAQQIVSGGSLASNPADPILNVYTFTITSLKDGGMFSYWFADGNKESGKLLGPVTMDDSQLTTFCFTGNLYYIGVNIVVFFFLIVLITTWMRSNLEKTRARLEAEGRLYPQGYGRCKECGTIILPGEVVCRKCGAYIDVPDEIKVKKVEYFECSDCGKEVPLSSDKCPFCGAAFEDDIEDETVAEAEKGPKNEVTFTCSECGKQVPESASVCPHCGEKFEDML